MTSSQTPITLDSGSPLGRVGRVDTNRVLVTVDDEDVVTRMSVGNLIAIAGAISTEYLVGIVDSITRALHEEAGVDDATDEAVVLEQPRDLVRIVLVGTFRTRDGSRANVFKRGADSFPQIDKPAWLIEGETLQGLMATLADEVPVEQRLVLGKFVADSSAVAVADGNRLFQRHAALLGSTGAGKSWSVALMLEKARQLRYPNLLVLDMHGEYGPLTEATQGGQPIAQGLRIAGPGDDPDDPNVIYLPYWMLTREDLTELLVDTSEQSAQNQHARIGHHVAELKLAYLQVQGADEVAQSFTLDSPIPFSVKELIERLEADNTGKVPGKNGPVNGPFHGKLSRLIARIETRVSDRRYGFMFSPPEASAEYDWLPGFARRLLSSDGDASGIKIVDFSEVPSDVLPLVAAALARVLYDVQFWMDPAKRTPLCIVCDEAHLYLPTREESGALERRALQVFERIAKEGRKYGVGLMVVSQRPADVSRTILSQCNNFVVMRLTNDRDQGVVRRLMPDALAALVDVMPLLDRGEALVLGDAMLLPTRLRFDPPTVHPDSQTRDFWTDWASMAPDDEAIKAGVEALRRQVRTPAPS
jgi:uncharacterized protein DUF87